MTLKSNSSNLIEFVNETSWHHPIHLHGHVFRVLTRNGKEVVPQQWADTVLLEPDSRAEIAFVADNPGDWMLHCHVLEHQVTGMMAVVRVA
jgi:FtsP/CotA-like multicopper oxidase with cupredoxin domain